MADCAAVSLYIYTTNNGKVAELEVKARQLEIELDLTIEKFGTVRIFFARHLVIAIRDKFSRFAISQIEISQCYK